MSEPIENCYLCGMGLKGKIRSMGVRPTQLTGYAFQTKLSQPRLAPHERVKATLYNQTIGLSKVVAKNHKM